ncbi:MAG: hypothetical protein IKT07_10635 [Oscillospiraceae bacterium]|nr:hypothetical protein [Oscillospiraceae bacterium]
MKTDQRTEEYRLAARKKKKINQDKRTLRLYWKQLRNERKEYGQMAEAFSLTGRRNKAAAVGECVLKLYDNLISLQAEKETRGQHLVNGTLFWGIEQQKVVDTDGKKGHKWIVWWRVKSDEPKHTDEEILQELRETYKKIKAETEEMFGPVEDDEYLDEEEKIMLEEKDADS